MIAITKELKQMLQELFEVRGVTEIKVEVFIDLLGINFGELEKSLKDEQLRDEFKLLQAKDGSYYIKRFLNSALEGTTMTSALNIKWENMGGCPCFTCNELDKCDIGNPISSVDCPLFTRWLFKEDSDEDEVEE